MTPTTFWDLTPREYISAINGYLLTKGGKTRTPYAKRRNGRINEEISRLMATNLTTIEVRLIANAQKFKKNVDQAKTKTKEFAKSTTNLKNKGKVAQESIRNLAGTIAAVQGPLGPVAGRLNSIGAILGRINIGAVIGVAAFYSNRFISCQICKSRSRC